jgi:hypothetical protein
VKVISNIAWAQVQYKKKYFNVKMATMQQSELYAIFVPSNNKLKRNTVQSCDQMMRAIGALLCLLALANGQQLLSTRRFVTRPAVQQQRLRTVQTLPVTAGNQVILTQQPLPLASLSAANPGGAYSTYLAGAGLQRQQIVNPAGFQRVQFLQQQPALQTVQFQQQPLQTVQYLQQQPAFTTVQAVNPAPVVRS